MSKGAIDFGGSEKGAVQRVPTPSEELILILKAIKRDVELKTAGDVGSKLSHVFSEWRVRTRTTIDKIENVDFEGYTLHAPEFDGLTLENVVFSECNFNSAKFQKCTFRNVKFIGGAVQGYFDETEGEYVKFDCELCGF